MPLFLRCLYNSGGFLDVELQLVLSAIFRHAVGVLLSSSLGVITDMFYLSSLLMRRVSQQQEDD